MNTWTEMNSGERRRCLESICDQTTSEEDLRNKLKKVGCTDVSVNWTDVDPEDERQQSFKAVFEAIGGFISKSGAMVSMMINNEQF